MRRFPVVPFDPGRSAYLRSRRIASIELFSGGACNSSYRVEFDTGAVVVVLYLCKIGS